MTLRDKTIPSRPLARLTLALVVVFGSGFLWAQQAATPQATTPQGATPQAATKKALSVDDYSRWRSITGAEISGDGAWVTYVLQLTNTPTAETKPVLHLLNLETNQTVSVPDATGA